MPVDRGAIDAQLREIGEGERWWEQREFRALPHILHADERIQGLINGKLLGAARPRLRPTARWLFVATDQRLICLKQERFARRQVDIASGQIVRVDQGSRLGGYQITIRTAHRKYRIRIPKADAFRFVGALTPLMPSAPVQRLHPDLEPLLALPGMRTVAGLPGVAGLVSKVWMLSPPEYATRAQIGRLQATVERLETDVERLETDVERLQQQVTFLEDLLQKRADEALLPGSAAES